MNGLENISSKNNLQKSPANAEAVFRLLVESAIEYAIFLLDSKGYITTWNPGAQRIKGYKAEEIIGKHFSRFYDAEAVEFGKPTAELAEAREKGYVEDEGWRIRKDGSRFWANVVITALRDETGTLVGFSKVTRDMTERMQAERELRESNIELQQEIERRVKVEKSLVEHTKELATSNADLRRFAYVVSHDLREPLRMVTNFSQLLERRLRGHLDEESQEFLKYIVNGVDKMGVLINDLLLYSRIETRGKPFGPTSCEKIFADVCATLQALMDRAEASVTHDPLPEVFGDETQLKDVFSHIIENAIKYRGSEPPRIHVSVKNLENEWQFCVSDNGMGIDERYLDRIFIIFQRLHRGDQFNGTGLGLALAKRIIERHGGRMWVESTVGVGSKFFFTVPIAGSAAEESLIT